jgi:sec-independent protein translocase protein TatB
MPSFSDSALIVFLALLLFGPKKLPELARQLGKLMGEFRRASNEFRMQMEEELRIADLAEQQKKIAAMEAAAPVTPVIQTENTIATPETTPFEPATEAHSEIPIESAIQPPATEPLPIASSGDLNLMPPATGLPEARSALSPLLDSIPQTPDPNHNHIEAHSPETTHESLNETATEASQHG